MHLRLLLLEAVLLFSFSILTVESQFYRGELEPRYSRKTPFRQQTDIPQAVFGIGHGARRFTGDKSREEPLSPPFFGERREPGRSSSGREDGRDYEENGEDDHRFGGRPHRGFGRRGEDEEEFEPARGGHDFKRPSLPDSSEVRERFDKDRESRKRGGDDEEEGETRHPARDRRPEGRRPPPDDRKREDEEEEEEGPRRPRPRDRFEEDEDRRGHRHPSHEEREPETEKIAETPSKVVGLNMQMVAGVYPKEKKGPEVEDVEDRGGRFVEKPDEKQEKKKFFRGSESQERSGEGQGDKRHEQQRGGDRRPARGDSGEAEKRGGGEGEEGRRRGEEEREERPHRGSREDEREGSGKQRQQPPQQQQQQAPPPPKPQIPPFPPFPKFPGFGGFQPFQPDFPTRQFGGNGGFAGGPWNQSGGAAGREPTPGDDVGSGEDRSGADRRRVHQPNPSSASSDDSRADDGSAERRDSGARHSKEDERAGGGGSRERSQEEPQSRHGPEGESEEGGPQKKKKISGDVYPVPAASEPPKREFPVPARFVTNIRTKKSGSGESHDATTTSTTSTSTLPTTMPTTTTAPAAQNVLPTESIVTKLRSIVNQKIKVA